MKQNRINIKVSGVPANVNQVTLGYYFNALIEVTSAVLNQTEESKDDGKKVDEVSVNKTNLPQPKNSFRIDPDGPMIIINVNLSKNISNKTRDKLQMEIEIVTKKIMTMLSKTDISVSTKYNSFLPKLNAYKSSIRLDPAQV